jgi:hypothetical protein
VGCQSRVMLVCCLLVRREHTHPWVELAQAVWDAMSCPTDKRMPFMFNTYLKCFADGSPLLERQYDAILIDEAQVNMGIYALRLCAGVRAYE